MKSTILKPVLQAAAIVLLSTIAAAITWGVAPPPDETACDPTTLKKGEICLESIPTDKEVLWIDARPRSDWERDGIEGSILWNYEDGEDFKEMEQQAALKIFTTPYVVVYCSDKGCGTSRKLADHIIEELQLPAEVHVLHGGWSVLKAAGRVPES